MEAARFVPGTLRSQPSTSFLVAGKREPRTRLRTRRIATHDTLHNSTPTFALLLSIVSLCTLSCRPHSDDCWVCQTIVPPTTRPHCHQNSAGDRLSASFEYLHPGFETNTFPYIQLPLPLHQRMGHNTVRHHNDTLSTESSKARPSAFYLKVHSLPSTLKQLLSHTVGPSN